MRFNWIHFGWISHPNAPPMDASRDTPSCIVRDGGWRLILLCPTSYEPDDLSHSEMDSFSVKSLCPSLHWFPISFDPQYMPHVIIYHHCVSTFIESSHIFRYISCFSSLSLHYSKTHQTLLFHSVFGWDMHDKVYDKSVGISADGGMQSFWNHHRQTHTNAQTSVTRILRYCCPYRPRHIQAHPMGKQPSFLSTRLL